MATLCLADPSLAAATPATTALNPPWQSPTLREWLAGDWGMLFSHPEDFQDRSLEQDRWLTIVREEFHLCSVRPLGCTTQPVQRDASWVGAISGDWRALRLEGTVADLPARQLRADIAALRSRFVLLIDAGLRRRGALPYRPGATRLSVLDLTASVSALRRRFSTVAPPRSAQAA